MKAGFMCQMFPSTQGMNGLKGDDVIPVSMGMLLGLIVNCGNNEKLTFVAFIQDSGFMCYGGLC